MQRILTAIRLFFRILWSAETARKAEQVLKSGGPEPGAGQLSRTHGKEQAAHQPLARSDALTLLATLQREARWIDFIKEPLGNYTDVQIGAAARDVHRDCGKVIERLFALRPLVAENEGAEVEVPVDFDHGRYRLTGQVTGIPPFHGRIVHHGWEASRTELP
ncbi:MAG: DUF2760 domain-containing protein, partial [Pirellulales bacterium]|nr:DUF2760 domain-containing protein [Pirellulales bacterium]